MKISQIGMATVKLHAYIYHRLKSDRKCKMGSSFDTAFIAAVAVIAAALLSGVFLAATTYWNLRLQKAQRLAEFRQAWINGLRDAMCKFQSLAVAPESDHYRARDFYEAGTRIQLYLNNEDPNYRPLLLQMLAMHKARDQQEKFDLEVEYIRISQDILRTEWQRLRDDLAASRSYEKAIESGSSG